MIYGLVSIDATNRGYYIYLTYHVGSIIGCSNYYRFNSIVVTPGKETLTDPAEVRRSKECVSGEKLVNKDRFATLAQAMLHVMTAVVDD